MAELMSTQQITRSSEDLEAVLERIISDPLDAVLRREAITFDQLAGPLATKLILFGAGALGVSTLEGLRVAGIEPLAFADNNSRLWGKEISGLAVLPPHEAVSQYGQSAAFVVTIYNGSTARFQLRRLGCRVVVPFTPLFWKYARVFIPDSCVELPHQLRAKLSGARECTSVLHDETSKRELLGQLVWRYWLDDDYLLPPLDANYTYFPLDLVSPREDEVFWDCGSFDGQTIQRFASLWNDNFRNAFAFEPDPSNLATLTKNVEAWGLAGRLMVFPFAIGDRNGDAPFALTGSVTSHMSTDHTSATVACRRLDDIPWPAFPTYIKMDIEGAEPQALAGAANLLRAQQPVLAICTYHRGEHLWQIPNLIHSICPEYRIFLRRYAEECWEGICYAIPPHRLSTA